MQVTIGGERLGAGKKMKANFNNYERSTHDLSYLWRSTMASGTLVPFMSELALPGDTFDIDLGCSVLTHPTIGPLFGSYKVQLDVFQVPIRLYHGALHMNMLEIGLKMNTIKLPQIEIYGTNNLDKAKDPDNQHINPSSIFSYLGIRGLGLNPDQEVPQVRRYFNAIPWLAYWDIYKQYYANKQEEIGAVIHNPIITEELDMALATEMVSQIEIPITNLTTGTPVSIPIVDGFAINIAIATTPSDVYLPSLYINWGPRSNKLINIFENVYYDNVTQSIWCYGVLDGYFDGEDIYGIYQKIEALPDDAKPNVTTFQLSDIDTMRTRLLQSPPETQFQIKNVIDLEPYNLPLQVGSLDGAFLYAATHNQEGLALKTYQSDLFNNWLSTEWIDGDNGISAVTAISTTGDSFTIDELNLSSKVYEMLNRIALSGGTYDDWLDAVYTHERNRGQENPAYLGGLIKELVFEEVVSNAATADEPLGTLAGRGKMAGKHKGGQVTVKIDEPSYIIGIVSITPRVDYSQGNKWDMNLQTMDDLHKPALDEIGFQDLITDQMAWFDTQNINDELIYKSAGKQPAWVNYMTNVNQVKGNFADKDNQMFMVLNRRYDYKYTGDDVSIKDLTTYIDPSKFNHIFADTRLDAQNFWTQISCDITARRKMSAKIIPNL